MLGSVPDAPATADSVDGADGSHPIGAAGSTIKLNTIRCNIRDDPQGNSTNIGQSARYPRISKTLQVVLCMSFKFSILATLFLPMGHLGAQDILNRVDAHDWELTVEIRLSRSPIHSAQMMARPMGFFVPINCGPTRPPD